MELSTCMFLIITGFEISSACSKYYKKIVGLNPVQKGQEWNKGFELSPSGSTKGDEQFCPSPFYYINHLITSHLP